jgi:hypothetical protein
VDFATRRRPTSTLDRLPRRADLRTGPNRGRDPEWLRDSRASARGPAVPWSAPLHGGVGSLHGLRVVEVARRLAPLGRHRPPASPAEVAERSRWRTSSEGRRPLHGRVPARPDGERHLGGDQKPMEDRASRNQQWGRRRYGLVDGARSRSRTSLAIPPKRRQRRLRSACECANRERRVPSAAPEKALRAGE